MDPALDPPASGPPRGLRSEKQVRTVSTNAEVAHNPVTKPISSMIWLAHKQAVAAETK
jgi:hypothetical protein